MIIILGVLVFMGILGFVYRNKIDKYVGQFKTFISQPSMVRCTVPYADNYTKSSDWQIGPYYLQKCCHELFAPQFMQSFGDTLVFWKHNYLFLKLPHNLPKPMCKLPIQYDEGMELIRQGDLYALRNGYRILVSQGLKGPWQVVFSNPASTGIRHSMVWTQNKMREDELLFSEYTTSWGRHHIYSYNVQQNALDTLQTFYSQEEHDSLGLEPFARHTHVMMQDPYTGYIYIGNGDGNDGSSAIYYSKDNCRTLIRIGAFEQCYRTLSFFFTEKSVFWNNDATGSTDEPQYVCRLYKSDLPIASQASSPIVKYPLVHAAHWITESIQLSDGENIICMSSNGEVYRGGYDGCIRTYGIRINSNEEPTIYELLSLPSNGNRFHQYYPLGAYKDKVLLMDNMTRKRALYQIVIKD
ncbi:MAG: hypothetical protein KBT27_12345 [Prevotellaceae bacterium]|nr:hypothetical protein [Candidatus Faecinaster equi]